MSTLDNALGFQSSIYIYILCSSVCLCPINLKTTELIESKFCLVPHITPAREGLWILTLRIIKLFQFFFIFVQFCKCAEKYY